MTLTIVAVLVGTVIGMLLQRKWTEAESARSAPREDSDDHRMLMLRFSGNRVLFLANNKAILCQFHRLVQGGRNYICENFSDAPELLPISDWGRLEWAGFVDGHVTSGIMGGHEIVDSVTVYFPESERQPALTLV